MHQPIYWPGENAAQTINKNRYPFSIQDVFNSRTGPYTQWPKNALAMAHSASLNYCGAQVSLSGSLIENLNTLELNGKGFTNWKSNWSSALTYKTANNHNRLDLIGFGYHHPLMPLTDSLDIAHQVNAHKNILNANFNTSYSKGIFTPENAFSTHIIPALKAQGLNWVLVDNIHFDRACEGYPYSSNGNLYEPNKAEILNPDPKDWVQLNGLWAPTKTSAQWGRQPHYAEYTEPNTGKKSKIIVVPADRYMGNEDGRGGFGALNYENVMSQLEQYNTDEKHPILIVLHHDGDNYGGGSESYYNGNFQNFVNWVKSKPTRFVCTTIEDYLSMFPPDTNDIIHVEPGSWSGADNGDPEYLKWNGNPNNCISPDRNSWGVVTANKNLVHTCLDNFPNNNNVKKAFQYLMNAQASDYWYWDGSAEKIWDTHPTRACNLAFNLISNQLNAVVDKTGPTIFLPQREPYNPGSKEWNVVQSSDVAIWTYVYDHSQLKKVELKYRLTPKPTANNKTYSGNGQFPNWNSISMTGIAVGSPTIDSPWVKAQEFFTHIKNVSDTFIDYYIESEDMKGNISKSIIQHTWIGAKNSLICPYENCNGKGGKPTSGPGGNTGGGQGGIHNPIVTWSPQSPTSNDTITIRVTQSLKQAKLHWGINNWQRLNNLYWPVNSTIYTDNIALQSPMSGPGTQETNLIKIGPFNKSEQTVNQVNFVINFTDNTWLNNNNNNYNISISQVPNLSRHFPFPSGIGICPNPIVKKQLNICNDYNIKINQITITDALGKVVLRTMKTNKIELPHNFNIGFVELEINGQHFIEKIIAL